MWLLQQSREEACVAHAHRVKGQVRDEAETWAGTGCSGSVAKKQWEPLEGLQRW